jgi:hypothetical protein
MVLFVRKSIAVIVPLTRATIGITWNAVTVRVEVFCTPNSVGRLTISICCAETLRRHGTAIEFEHNCNEDLIRSLCNPYKHLLAKLWSS